MSVPRKRLALRIIQVTPTYAPCKGGAERMIQAVSERLAARGHQVTIFTINGATQGEIMSVAGGTLPERERINGVRVRRFTPEGWLTRALRTWTDLPGGWRSAGLVFGEGVGTIRRRPSPLGLVPALLGAEVDVVTSVNWVWAPAYAGHLARRVRRFALVGVPILHIARPWAESESFPPMLAECDAVLALTQAEAAFIAARGGRNPIVTGVGVTPGEFRAGAGRDLRTRLKLGDRPVVGFIGRQDRLKGVVTLIEAMRSVWREMPETWLLLAGQVAHRSRDVTAALDALTAEERGRVVLLDDFTDEDATHVAATCDIVALPSVEEAFGIVYLEAWMCGKPVIGARIASTECVIDDGADGLLAEPLDSADLARCLLALLRDPDLRDRMGRVGREKALARWTWDLVTDRWEAALRGVTAI